MNEYPKNIGFRTAAYSASAMVIVGAILWVSSAWSAVNHSTFQHLLEKYNQDGNVDYAGFKGDESRLDAYLEILSGVDPGALPRAEKFAFYVNAYNAWTIKLILSGYPGIESIKDMGSIFRSPWKKEFVRLNGKTVTLDHIEHDILRSGFKDPRVHFVVNCASKSCPPLLKVPLTGETADAQMDAAARRFINDSRYNRLEGSTLYVSRIFKWFSEDFNDDVMGFFLRYAEPDLKKSMESRDITVKYLEYDWSLNGS